MVEPIEDIDAKQLVRLTAAETGRLLGINAQTVVIWCKTGKLLGKALGPRGPWSIDPTSVEALAAQPPSCPAGALSVADIAEHLRLPARVVRELAVTGDLKSIDDQGQHFTKEAVAALLDAALVAKVDRSFYRGKCITVAGGQDLVRSGSRQG